MVSRGCLVESKEPIHDQAYPFHTPDYKATSTISAIIKNVGTVAQSNIPVSYSVNGGTPISAVSSGLILPNEIDTVVFTSTLTNAVGVYNIKVFSALSSDTTKFNDTASTSFKIIENAALILPFTESFEGMPLYQFQK